MTRAETPEGTPELTFTAADVTAAYGTVVPTLDLRFRIDRSGTRPVRNILLTTTVSVAPTRRYYDADEQSRLVELFGAPQRWDTTLHELEWTRTTDVVAAFTESTTVVVRLPCSYDYDLATTKYLHAVRQGDITLVLRFSGTVFHHGPERGLQATQLPWDQELTATFPVVAWHELIDRYYGSGRWVRLGAACFDRLAAYKAQQARVSWDDAVDELLDRARKGDRT